MTTINAARESTYQRMDDEWGESEPVTYPGRSFAPPASGGWVRLSVIHSEADQDSLGPTGGRSFSRKGTIRLEFFTPINTGMQRLDEMTTEGRRIFEGVSFGGVDCTRSVMREVGEDGKWNKVELDTDFTYYEQK